MSTRPVRLRRALIWSGGILGALALALLITVFALERIDLRGPVARLASARLGQPVRIDGALDLHLLTLTPRAAVNGLELGNRRDFGPGEMARVERILVEVSIPALLRGAIVLPRLEIDRPRLRLYRDASGRTNWPQRRGEPPGQRPSLPIVRRFSIDSARVDLVDEVRGLEFTGLFDAGEVAGGGDDALKVSGRGSMNGQPFKLDLQGAALVNVRRNRPYPFRYVLHAGETHMSARGTFTRPFTLDDYTLDLALSGKNFADLYQLTGLLFPGTPPYEVQGQVRRSGGQLGLRAFKGRIGDSDVDFDGIVDLTRERPLLKASVVSGSLDLDDLGVAVGGTPSIREGETASAEQRAEARALAAKSRLFPDSKLQMQRLRRMDADVDFRAEAVKTRKVPLREVSFALQIDNGVLTLDPVSFILPQGKVSGTARVDARQDLPVTTIDARLTGLQLGQFRPRTAKQAPIEGTLIGRATLKGFGSSVHDFVSTASGELTIVLPSGEVREAFAELTGINVARGLGLLITDDQDQTRVRCGVADFNVKRGKLQAEHIVFDTENVLISGRGEVDLEKEAYDLEIRGEPKKLRLFRVRAPIAIRGPLRKPDVGPETGDSLKQTGIAAALAAAVAPLAAVLAFVDPGLAEDANCAALLAEAKREGAPVKKAEVEDAKRG